ncbi:polysaccharide biosynthesis/export family protein [soil metagenome]
MQVKNSVCLVLLSGLAGCATLPSSGPTGSQIVKSVVVSKDGPPIQIVQIDTIENVPNSASDAPRAVPLQEVPPPPTDMIGSGDVLDISIYEAGVTLFTGGGGAEAMNQIAANPGVQVQKLPPSRVDDNGNITIPYAGKLHVAGHTVSEVEAMVRSSLRRMSQNPQVLITLSEAITNSIIIGGEVVKPGRLVLRTNRETLSDAIALAGGYRGNARDLILRIVRGTASVDVRLADLVDDPALDMRAYPGDRLMLVSSPLTFTVLGASGRVEQLPFSRSSVSLAEAVATAGGANPNLGDPAAIFLFRYKRDEKGIEVPVVYHLNMMKGGSYLFSQRFAMHDKDVLYFGNAAANQPTKAIQLVSQLFSPILTVTSAVQTVQNSRN